MGDRVARFEIGLGGDDADIKSLLSGLRSQFKSAVSDIEATTNKLELFGQLQSNLPKIKEAMDRNAAAAAEFRKEIERTTAAGGKVSDDLTKGLAAAEKAASAATKEYAKQNAELANLGTQLKARNVDIQNQAVAQQKLAAELKAASAAAEQNAAKQALGIKTLADAQPQIDKLRAAYETLRASGTLSAKELTIAQQQMTARIAETQNSVTQLASTSKSGGVDLVGMFKGSLLPALGLTATIGGLVAALSSAVDQAKAVKQALAEIGSITTLTPAQLNELGAGARRLAVTLGIDVNDALKQLFELIQSGVPSDNALAVLEIAARAAKAALVDTGTGVKVANLLIDAFNSDVGDLAQQFDILVNAQQHGGASLKAFAEAGGPLLNIAREYNVEFPQLVSVLTVMTDRSGDAAGSIANLGKILSALNTPDARDKLEKLGITTRDLVEIFQQLGERGIGVNEFIGLELAGRKAAASVAALTNNVGDLVPALQRQKDALDAVKKSNDALYDSPAERSKRFNAQLKEAEINIGNLVGSGSKLAQIGTSILAFFNQIGTDVKTLSAALDGADGGTNKMIRTLLTFKPAAEVATKATTDFADAQKDAGKQAEAAAALIKQAAADLAAAETKLTEDIKARQAAVAADIAAINVRAEAEIAALDRSREATAKTAAETAAIQLKAADDKLELIKKNEQDITDLTTLAIQTRTTLLFKQKADTETIIVERAKIEKAAIGDQIKVYETLYSQLNTQAQAHLGRVAQLEQQRVTVVESAEREIFNLRLAQLSGLDQYVAKAREVERLISEARVAGAKGDIDNATKYTNESIALAKSLGPVYSANGAQIVSSAQAQQKAIDLVGKAQQGLVKDIDSAKDKEGEAASALQERMKDVSASLVILQVRFNNLRNTIDQGFDVQVSIDVESANKAIAQLDELSKPRTVVLKVEIDTTAANGLKLGDGTLPLLIPGSAQGGFIGRAVQAFRRGGTVGAFAQRFAAGGMAFRRPSWDKVPGSGDGDTVPAALSEGSFVVRKAASRLYGDGVMLRLAQAFAGGGTVGTIGDIASRILGSTNPTGSNLGGGVQSEAQQVIAYALEVLGRFSRTGNGRNMIARIAPLMRALIERLSRNPGDQAALDELLKDAESIGLNLHLVDFVDRSTSPGGFATADLSYADFKSGAIPDRQRRPFGDETANGLALALGLGADTSSSGSSAAFTNWFSKVVAPVFGRQPYDPNKQGSLFRFAGGGTVGDIVPAMLTPGEFVLTPKAVSSVSQLFGGGFLPALNAMKVPRGFFDGMTNLAPPPRPLAFATGGPVPGGEKFAAGGSVRGRAGGGVTINIYAQKVDEAEVRRSVVPALNKIIRRSR